MKKLRRVIGSVANLTSNRNEDQPATSTPKPGVLSNSRRSVSGPLQETSPQRGSYYSYETQSLDSFNSGMSSGTTHIDPYSKGDKYFTKLHKWAYLGDTNKLKKFIKKVPVDAQDSDGKTALHHAASQGHGDALLFLLGSKSNVEMKDNAGMTAFLRAVEKSQQHIVQMLIQRRVEINVADYQGNSSIHLAARTGATDLLLMLLECGSDCDSPNNLGRMPLHVACAENQEEAVEALLRHGASVNVADKESVTPLMVAAKMGSVPLVEVLIDNGASITPMDASKWTAADYARFTNHNQLHHRLKTLLDKEGGVSLIPQGLLSVSDEGSDQTDGAVAAQIKKPSDVEEEEEGSNNSWSDTSDVNSVKEKPKLNLTKFLPSSDESMEDVPGVSTDHPGGALGPPKPPRLYASSSSLASGKAGTENDSEAQEREDTAKDNDSWKSSSEDEAPKVKSLGLFVGNLDSSLDHRKSDNTPGIKTRVEREDLMLELGLKDMKYEVSDEEISFEEEKSDLPLERTPTRVVINPRSKASPDQKHSCRDESQQISPTQQFSSRNKNNKGSVDSFKNKISVQPVSPSQNSVRSDSSKKFKLMESPVKFQTKRSPRKANSHRHKSNTFDSDSDEGESVSLTPQKKKSSTPKRQEATSLTKQLAVDENSLGLAVDHPVSKSDSNKGSKHLSDDDSSQESLSEHGKEKGTRPRSGKHSQGTLPMRNNGGEVSHLLLPSHVDLGSHTNTLSTVVGTLGREGTMQEVEEMWEANPRRQQKSSTSSNSSSLNSKGSHQVDGKSEKEDGDGIRGKDETCISVACVKKAAHTQETLNRKANKDESDGFKMNAENDDTAQDVSDDDFGSSGVEDLLASKVKASGTQQPLSTSKIAATPRHGAGEVHSRSQEGFQQPVSHNKPVASGEQKSSSTSLRDVHVKQNTISLQSSRSKISSPITESRKMLANKKREPKSPRCPSHKESTVMAVSHKGDVRYGLSGVILSDEDSFGQDHLASPHSLEGLDDRISITSTETEESTHINSALKDSLLAPLSSLPDASNVDQLQDLVRELRLKLEKEHGHRKDLEARVSHLKQREKKARRLYSQQEENAQQKQQEITSLMARIKQLEYQGHSEQDSLILRDHSLQDAQQRCGQLEEQCGALQVHAQQQEQLVNSLMVQLHTKERINLTLQEKLEELSSQTKYVSMKSCQTEDFLMFFAARESVQAQTDCVDLRRSEDRQTQATPTVSESFAQTEISKSGIKPIPSESPPVVDVAKTIEISTQFTQTEPEQKTSTNERGTQSVVITMTHASSQFTPERAFKTCQTHLSTKSSYSQTDSNAQYGFETQRKAVNDFSCQTVSSNKQAGIQTNPFNVEAQVDPVNIAQNNLQTETLMAALENVLQDFSQDIKSMLRPSEEGQSSLDDIKKSLSSQLTALTSSLTTTLQQTSDLHTHENVLQVQEGICQLQDTLHTQMEILKQHSQDPSQAEMQNLHEVVEKLHMELNSSINTLGSRIIEAFQSHIASQQEQETLIASLMDQKKENCKILTNISGQLEKRSDHEMERFNDLKQQISAQLTDIKKVIEFSSVSEDSGIAGNLTKGVVEKLDSIEKSLTLGGGRGCVSEELSGVQFGVQQLSDNLHKKVAALEELIRMVNSDSKLEQAALMEQTKAISDTNDHLTTLVKLRLSEANSDLSEAIEENFRIVQDQLLHLQQTIVQRINEVSEHISIGEDKKGSNLARQMMEIASQVSGLHGGLVQLQSSVQQAHSTPMAGGVLDEALISSFKMCHEQTTETLRVQNDSIIRQLEALQKEIYSSMIQGKNVKERHEVQVLKESLKEKESDLAALEAAKEQMQEKLNHQKISLSSLQTKEEEWMVKIEILQDRIKDLTENLKEKEREVQQQAAKSTAQSEEAVKLRQENFRLSSEHAKVSAMLQVEQQQRQWCEGELQGLREAKDVTERRIQEIMSYVQQSSLQRTPPTGRDNDEDDTVATWKQDIKKLEVEKKKLEDQCTEQQNLARHLELQLTEAEAAVELEKHTKTDLEKQLKKAKESMAKLQQQLSDMKQQQEVMRDIESRQAELEMEIKARVGAMDTLRKKLEAVNKEKLDLKNSIMQLKEEKLSCELIKQEKELSEQMQKKTEEQLHDLQTKITRDYVSKATLHVLQKELESKYQLELSTKLAELNHIIQQQNKQQESLTKNKDTREQELKNELNRKSEEVIRLNAKLSVLDERGDTWRVRHDRLLALYQQQADLNHSLSTAKKHQEDPLAVTLQEIDKHLKTPLAQSAFLGQLPPSVSLQLPPPPSNIDSYHYTHTDALDRTLQSYLNTSTQSRYSVVDDKPQAKISPLPASPHHSQHLTHIPDLEQSRDEYVDLLKMKYGI